VVKSDSPVEVVDVDGMRVGALDRTVGTHVGIERGGVVWFVPQELVEHTALGPARLHLRAGAVAQIDLLSGGTGAA
jgi:hypothetical protein